MKKNKTAKVLRIPMLTTVLTSAPWRGFVYRANVLGLREVHKVFQIGRSSQRGRSGASLSSSPPPFFALSLRYRENAHGNAAQTLQKLGGHCLSDILLSSVVIVVTRDWAVPVTDLNMPSNYMVVARTNFRRKPQRGSVRRRQKGRVQSSFTFVGRS